MRISRKSMLGFTLLELMVTVAIVVIIGAIAAPSFREMVLRSRLVGAGNELAAMMQLAKIEAIRSNGVVELCGTADGSTCDGGDWTRSIVISHKNGEDLILREFTMHDSIVATGDGNTAAANNTITFRSDGFARVGNAGTSGSVLLCVPGLAASRSTLAVNINVSRVEVTQPEAGQEGCQ